MVRSVSSQKCAHYAHLEAVTFYLIPCRFSRNAGTQYMSLEGVTVEVLSTKAACIGCQNDNMPKRLMYRLAERGKALGLQKDLLSLLNSFDQNLSTWLYY